MHYTLHDLSQEIVYRQERDRRTAWENGARFLEAIGVAFTKGKKYSEEPTIVTEKEVEQSERDAFYEFANAFKNVGK